MPPVRDSRSRSRDRLASVQEASVGSDQGAGAAYRTRLGELWQEVRSRHLASADVIVANLGPRGSVETAANAAHRLAGTLSIFELPAGARLAHEIEDALDLGHPVPASDVERLREMIRSHEIR